VAPQAARVLPPPLLENQHLAILELLLRDMDREYDADAMNIWVITAFKQLGFNLQRKAAP
jgi:hypothetical protein